MAFKDLAESLRRDLPQGASDRYRTLEALGRMLNGTLYDHLKYSWEEEKGNGKHIQTRERRPSTDFCLPWEITQDTLAELFGDEQFPTIRVGEDEDATKELANLIEAVDMQSTMVEAYEEGVIGSVGVVVHETAEGPPYYEILPGKWCEPTYRDQFSNTLIALTVSYPITDEKAEELFPGITKKEENRGETIFWYRYIVGPSHFVFYYPLSDKDYARLGENDEKGEVIEFKQDKQAPHGFAPLTPAVYVKNLGGKQRELDGPALWWPIRNFCIVIDYTLSQADRGLRYSADPMLFLNPGNAGDAADFPGGYAPPGGGMATTTADDGSMVKGVTQTFVGYGKDADAKLLEIGAGGIREEREFIRDCREYALEVLGGMKARAEDSGGPTSGRALDKTMKPLRRLIRRQRRPYGLHLLVALLKLTLHGISNGALIVPDVDATKISVDDRYWPEWPSDDVLQGSDLFYHIQGLMLAAGGSLQAPLELIAPEAIGTKMSGDLGYHQPYESLKGSLKPFVPPEPKTSSGS